MSQPNHSEPTGSSSTAMFVLKIMVSLCAGLCMGIAGFLVVEHWMDHRESSLAVEIARQQAAAGNAKILTLQGSSAEAALAGEVYSLRTEPRRVEWSRPKPGVAKKVEGQPEGQVEWVAVDLSEGDLRSEANFSRVAPIGLGFSLLFALLIFLALQPWSGSRTGSDEESVARRRTGRASEMDEETRLALERWGVEAATAVQAMAGKVRILIHEAKLQRKTVLELSPQLKELQKKLEAAGTPETQELAVEVALLRDQLSVPEGENEGFSEAVKGLSEKLRAHLEHVSSLEQQLKSH